MPTKTVIGWTDFSSNPLRYRDADGRDVWACVKVSAGCQHCYSATLAKRWGRGGDFNAGEMAQLTPYLDEREMDRLRTSKALSGKRVFLADMTDVFGEWVPELIITELFAMVAVRRDVTFQVLTKRPQRMRDDLARLWPLANCWFGTSVENQAAANERIPYLLATSAAIRFVSAEPLLGPISLRDAERCGYYCDESVGHVDHSLSGLHWLIAGGESGPGYRPMDLRWLSDITEECELGGVKVYVKQDSGRLPGKQGRIPDRVWAVKQFPEAVPA